MNLMKLSISDYFILKKKKRQFHVVQPNPASLILVVISKKNEILHASFLSPFCFPLPKKHD